MDKCFEEFKKRIRKRLRILASSVMKHYNEVYFFAYTNNTFVQMVKPRKAWLKSFGYEIEVDDVSARISALLKE